MAFWPFQPSRASEDAERLVRAVTTASRQPELFSPGRIPDTLEGRFEAMTLHASLVLLRLRADPNAPPLGQAFADRFFRTLDAGLREAGVGDLAVPKRMRALAGGFYGRLEAYSGAVRAEDAATLAAALGRNIFADEAHPYAPVLADYVLATARVQARAPVEALFVQDGWPPVP